MKYLSFFKVLFPSSSSERLLLPLAFADQVKGRIPDEAFLRNYNGKVWPVKVTKDGNRFHFCDGWPKFVEDNSLELGVFLVFDYDLSGVFYVQIFERTGCLKEKNDDDDEEEEEEEEEEVEVEEVEEEVEVEVEEEVEVEVEEEEVEEEEEEEEEDMGHGDAVVMQELESTSLRNGNKGKAAIRYEDIDDVFEHGFVSRPKNPFFVTRPREKSRRTELFIPTDVIKDFGLELPEELIVLDESGRKWPSKVIRWNDGRTWVTNGWKSFCKRNYVKREDRLICEFVPGEGSKGIQLKVCILRNGSWLPKGGKS